MKWLNYHHLYYFWNVARAGSIAAACKDLYLTQPTISKQIHSLENALGGKLFGRSGRNIQITPFGRTVLRYADEIFSLGRELQESIHGSEATRPMCFRVGIAEAMPSIVVSWLLQPVLRLPQPVKLVCEQGVLDGLLGQLAAHSLDVVLADTQASPASGFCAFNHLLGECGVSFWASPELAASSRKHFPRSLNGAPFILPGANSALARSLRQWFEQQGVSPTFVGEISDPALLKAIAEQGIGIFAARSVMEKATKRIFNVRFVGRADDIRGAFYAISLEKKVRHPAVVAITQEARKRPMIL